MAKRVKGTDKWVPGVIYELRYKDGDVWVPFYIGESINADTRKSQHIAATTNEEERLVYEATAALNEQGIEWDLVVVVAYGEEGPADLEDQYVMNALLAGYKLTNMKRGNANWLAQRELEAVSMKKHGFTDVKAYRKQTAKWDAEAAAIKAENEQMERIAAQDALAKRERLLRAATVAREEAQARHQAGVDRRRAEGGAEKEREQERLKLQHEEWDANHEAEKLNLSDAQIHAIFADGYPNAFTALFEVKNEHIRNYIL